MNPLQDPGKYSSLTKAQKDMFHSTYRQDLPTQPKTIPPKSISDLGYTSPDALEIQGFDEEFPQPAVQPVTKATPTTTAPTGGILPGSKVENQGKPGYDVFGNPVAGFSQDTTSTSTSGVSGIEAEKEALSKKRLADAQAVSDKILGIQNGSVPLTPGQNAQIEGLKQQFQQLISDQEIINTGASGTANIRGYQQGAGEYDPNFQQNIIGSIVTAGANKVASLNTKMASAVAALTQSFQDNNIANIKQAYDILEKAQEERQTEIEKTVERVQAQIKEANKKQEEKKAIQLASERDTVIADLLSSGITDPSEMLLTLNDAGGNFSAKEISESMKNLTKVEKAIPGIVGEWMAAKENDPSMKGITLEQYMNIKDPGRALDLKEQQLRIQKIQNELGGNGMLGTDNKIMVNTTEARKISSEIVKSDAHKVIKKGQTSLGAIDAFKKLFDTYGSTSGVTSPFDNAKVKSAYNAAILDLKEFFNLGVLNGPDETILKGILPDPTSQGFVTNISAKTATESGIKNMKDKIEETLDDRYNALVTQYGDYSPQSVGALKDLNRIYVEQKIALDPKLQAMVIENPNLTEDDILSIILYK